MKSFHVHEGSNPPTSLHLLYTCSQTLCASSGHLWSSPPDLFAPSTPPFAPRAPPSRDAYQEPTYARVRKAALPP